MKLREFKVFDRFDRSRPVAVVMASSPIHALDLYATNNDFPPYSQLATDEPDANWVYEHDGKLWGIWMNSEVFVELPSAEDVAGAMLFRSAVARGKREILDDVARGVIPAHVTSFGQLHDFVDANEYAGLCDSAIMEFDGEDHRFAAAVQEALHQWIAGGQMLVDAQQRQPDNERIAAAVKEAEDAFWSTIAGKFPEVTTGDMDPPTVFEMQSNFTHWVNVWLRGNHPFWQGRDDH